MEYKTFYDNRNGCSTFSFNDRKSVFGVRCVCSMFSSAWIFNNNHLLFHRRNNNFHFVKWISKKPSSNCSLPFLRMILFRFWFCSVFILFKHFMFLDCWMLVVDRQNIFGNIKIKREEKQKTFFFSSFIFFSLRFTLLLL